MPQRRNVPAMKVYPPTVLDSLGESLRVVYWYKDDLRSFLVRAGVPERIVRDLPWGGYKRGVVRALLDLLARNPASGTPLLTKLIESVVEQDESFPHLARLPDGLRLVAEARSAVRTLKDILGHQTVAERAAVARSERRTEARRAQAELVQRKSDLRELHQEFLGLAGSQNPNQRGLDFQPLLRRLFALYDLEPRGGFAGAGEQIDGSIQLDGKILLVEAKWTADQTSPSEVRDFRAKVHDKLESTLGLMIAVNGFTEQAIEKASGGGRLLLVLMDGQDLARVLEGVDDLVEVLRRKLRYASEHGRAFTRA